MRKLVLFLGASAMLFACQEEDQAIKEKPNITPKSPALDYSQYDVYDPGEEVDPVTEFSDFINTPQEQIVSNYGLAEAIWYLEGSTNYYFRKKLFDYDSLNTNTYSYDVEAPDNIITAADIKVVSDNLLFEVLNQIGSTDNALQVADVYIDTIVNGVVSFNIDAVVGHGVNYSFATPLPTTASDDRDEWDKEDCNGNTKPNNGFNYVEKLAHNKVINNTNVPGSKYHFHFNVIRYWDDWIHKNRAKSISSEYLFSRPNDLFPPSTGGDCLPKSEINGYTSQVYNDVSTLLSPGDEVVIMDVYWAASLCLGCSNYGWQYENVKISKNHLATPGLTPHYLGEL